MHYYKDLVLSGTAFTLNALDEAQLNVVKKIQDGLATKNWTLS